MTDEKKPKGKRRSRKTPVAGAPEAASPIAAEVAAPAEAAPAATVASEPVAAAAAAASASKEPVAEAASALKEPVAEAASAPKEPVAEAASAPKEPVAEAASALKEPVAEAASAPKEPAAEAASALKEPVAAAASALKEPVAEAASALKEPVAEAASALKEPVAAAEAASAAPAADEARSRAVRASDLDLEALAAEVSWPERERRSGERRVGERRAGFEASPVAIDDDGWPLESADPDPVAGEPAAAAPAPAAPAPPPAAPAASPSSMPSPAAAAYEAARIVGEMVGDIESAPGAALVAAAAAGAAIEMARARVAAGESDRPPPALTAAEAASSDPATTVRMQRDRILRALAEDIGSNATATAEAEAAAAAEVAAAPPSARAEPGRAPSHSGRAGSHPQRDELAADDLSDDRLDPVALASAAIARLRARARSDLAELRVHYHRLDMLVLLGAFIIIVIAGRVHDGLVTPPTVPFDPSNEHGLSFDHPRGWLAAPGDPLPPPRIVHESAPAPTRPAALPFRVELTATSEPTARIEVLIDKKPGWSNIVTGLDLDRRTRWGELYTLDDSSVRSVEDHQWLRTAYRFAHAADKGDVPRIDRALEYATIDREQIYVITLFGSAAEIDRLEDVIAPTLRVATQTGLPLVPQTGHLSARKYPNAVSRAFEATVMVVVADVVDGRLRARGGGSGVIVGKDGSILTNYHVIHDRNGRLHDAFVIGRFSDQDKAPQLHCAGKPSRSKLQRELDLALIKCDLDLDGRAWIPTSGGAPWPTLPQAHTADIKMGQRIWVLGYPDVGGGGLTLSEGEVEGWSGVDGAAGRDFIKTDAAIRHGNSGGPVVGDDGRLVGIASAVRTKQNSAGDIIEVVQAGGRVRPIAAASDLLAIAAAGWTPREGQTDVELQPSAIEAPSEGAQIGSRVVDVASEAPVRDALVMVMRAGINAGTVDVNRLDDQVLSYGRSNAQGEVVLKQPVPAPGTYTLMVVARGYEPMIGELTLETDTPATFDPWGKLQLRAR